MSAPRYLALALIGAILAFAHPAPPGLSAQSIPAVIISEVHPAGSGNGTYGSDWFEVTNTGTTPVELTGWRMDDNSNAFASGVALNGVTTIAPGQSVVFMETTTPTNTAAFTAAWFGANIPAGLVVGTYGGMGVGLGNGGDAVNLFDASGNRVTGISFGTATATATFDNSAGLGSTTLPLPAVSAVSVAGVNGAFVSASGGETGSPGRRVTSTPVSSLDLSLYVRVGRFDLPEPTRTPPPPDSLLAQEVSAVTYNWDSDTLFVVGDGGTSIVQVTKTGVLVDSMTLAAGGSPQGTEFYDPEGLTYVGNGQFVLVEERDRQFVRFTYAPGTTLTRGVTQTVKLGTFVDNIGIEGLSYDPLTEGFIAVKETQPQGLFQTGVDFAAGTATNGSPTAANSTNLFPLVEPFAGLLDFADVFALSNLPSMSGAAASQLLVLSQESGRIVHIDRSGQVLSALTIVSDPGNPLSVSAQQHEGLTMDRSGRLYVVSENGGGDFDHPQLWVYEKSSVPNQPPTAIVLNNQVTTIAENASTATRLKVADVAITDDGIGTNNLTVSGSDAAAFEVDGSGLFIRAGTALDFETKNSYSIVVAVDDPTLGATPDATANYALTVTDVADEAPLSTVVISEVAPWASGNSPYGADWFELTNTGEAPVSIGGWRMDDSSASFANAVALSGIATIAPGESVIFLEASAGSPPSTLIPGFISTWFGSSAPAGLQVGTYQGGGVGLSTGGDAVTVFDATGSARASVTFGASPGAVPFGTFDNAAGANDATITLLSVAGVNGAFAAAGDASEIGSPGNIGPPPGRLIVSEVAPWSSGNSPIGADWFEVTNVGGRAVDITGWKVDDSSESFAAAVLLTGVTAIAPGESVIFIETSDPLTAAAAFRQTWFGASPPPALQIGSYSGGGIGLSTGGDAVNLYSAAGVRRAKVFFGVSPGGPTFATFDNAAGLDNANLSQLSVAGINGAFVAANDVTEIGSPGTIALAANDDDGDGFTNADEIGSAGSPPGNLLGSNPLNPLSTPEACDALDNDLNEGTDEGFPNADGDAEKDCVDSDDDGDGIADAVDPAPLNAANQTFSDALAPLNGTTSGTILTRGGRTVVVDDATPNPATGIDVMVSGATTGSAVMRLDGKTAAIALPDGVYVLTDPAATTTVTAVAGGPAQIAMVLDGFAVDLTVAAGASVTYTETIDGGGALTGLTVDAVAGSVVLNGKALTGAYTLVGPPQDAAACKQNGWRTFNFPTAFRNQGDCVSFVNAAGKPPQVKVPGNLRLEAASPSGAVATFIATATDAIEGALPAICTPTSGSTFPLGETTVTCSATNLRGHSDSETFRVWVRDTMSPDIIAVTPSVTVLPDTDEMVPVSIAVAVTDIADPAPACRIVRVTGQGRDLNRDAVIDWVVTGDLTLSISANARRNRDRTYTITVRCTDAAGNPSRDKAAIVISPAS